MSTVSKVAVGCYGVELRGNFKPASNDLVWLTKNNARETANRILELTGGNEESETRNVLEQELKRELKIAVGQLRASDRQVAALEFLNGELEAKNARQYDLITKLQDEIGTARPARVTVLVETDGKIRRQEFTV